MMRPYLVLPAGMDDTGEDMDDDGGDDGADDDGDERAQAAPALGLQSRP
jgi:hypothetical protein